MVKMLSLRRLHSDFMLRSEKRPGFSNKRRPRRRVLNKAKFFYIITTLIMLLAVFPIGAVMLWRNQRAALEAYNKAQTAVYNAASRVGKNFTAIWDNAPQIAVTVYRGVRGGAVYASRSIILSADVASRDRASAVSEPPSHIEATEAAAQLISATPDLTVLPVITPGPTPTPKSTVNPELLPKIKPMGEMAVWFTNDGKWYHENESCGTMRGAKRYALNEAIRQKKTRCPYCEPPPPEIASVVNGVWVDDVSRVFHIKDDCDLLGLKWTAEPVADAAAEGCAPCEECGAYHYLHNLAFYNTPPPSKSAVNTAAVDPNTVVFITEKSVFYHSSASCQALNMMSPSTILDAVDSDLKPCSICGAIKYNNQ
jgi:hypothetical protein